MYNTLRKYIVEFLGTLIFLHVILTIGNSLLIGATLALMIYLFGPTSGGHFNPAVTIMMAASKKTPWSDVAPYIISQIAGGLAAIHLHKLHLYITK
jgi:glycerol uptake facilitator-like aquaporin